MITRESYRGNFEGLSLAPILDRLSHFFFADDIMIFYDASTNSCRVEVLHEYYLLSGQAINYDKCKMVISNNAIPKVKSNMIDI